MCWCVKVFFELFGNLTSRLFSECTAASYKMCCVLCLRPKSIGEHEGELNYREWGSDRNLEPFYQDVDRSKAEDLLEKKQNGTFIVRPSRGELELGVLTIVQDRRLYHLAIRRRQDGLVALGKEKTDEKCFKTLDALINYYVSNYLILYSDGVKSYTLLLPFTE